MLRPLSTTGMPFAEDLMIFMTSKDFAHRARLACLALGAALLLTVSVAAQAGRAYVSNEDGHTVTVIDTEKNEVIATIPVGKRPRGILVSNDGKCSMWP
jgi:YVTN family beta-propeller protein